jgi:hypothetical protein
MMAEQGNLLERGGGESAPHQSNPKADTGGERSKPSCVFAANFNRQICCNEGFMRLS